MTDSIRPRRRRRRSTESKDTLPISELQKLIPDSDRVRQRRTSTITKPQQIDEIMSDLSKNVPTPRPEKPQTPTEVSTDNFIIDETKITNPFLVNTIDQIKAEISEESCNEHNSLYWDDTHNWCTTYSSDYQHFCYTTL